MGFFDDMFTRMGALILGQPLTNRIAINLFVNKTRNRPHPWSTRSHYISWAGLTDQTYNARLLPSWEWPDPHSSPGPGVIKPSEPLDTAVASLFVVAPGDSQRPCPKSTCLFPAFAQYLTDGFLRTQLSNDRDKEDRARTTSNHQIDLSTLYGRTAAQTRVLRLGCSQSGRRGRMDSQEIDGEEWSPYLFDATGKVKDRYLGDQGTPILDLPLGMDIVTPGNKLLLFAVGGDRVNAVPQTSMMNTLFLREHNRLAGVIEAKHPSWDDDQVFETARNITIVMFIKIVVEEYINHINTTSFRFVADPSVAWTADWNRPNWMTTEFTLLYRWHSLAPQRMKWGEGDYQLAETRLNNGPLLESGLAKAFVEQSAQPAAELGLGNAAEDFRAIEVKGLNQGRANKIQGYAAYRRAMKLKVPRTFEELVGSSSDPGEKNRRQRLARELEKLYGTVDKLEYYPGLFAEPRAKNGPLPELVTAMVAMDAFSQALTNPLLSKHVFGNRDNSLATFTADGLEAINKTKTLRDVLARNVKSPGLNDQFVGMTRPEWKRS